MTADTISFGGNESSVSVLKIIVMYTFSLSSTFFFCYVHFAWVNCMACALHFNLRSFVSNFSL